MSRRIDNGTSETWVFGYASILWKTDFPFAEKVHGYIKDFERKFWQASVHHRGLPDKPGRVATLVSKPGGVVWGAAYRLPHNKKEEILRHLDFRETGGYEPITTLFYPRGEDNSGIELIIYVATPDNPNFIGPKPLKEITDIILKSSGHSGSNVDYVLNLAEYVKTNIPEDQDNHLFQLEQMVREGIEGKGHE